MAVGEGHGKADKTSTAGSEGHIKAGTAGSDGHIKVGAASSEGHVKAGIEGHPEWSIAVHKYTIH